MALALLIGDAMETHMENDLEPMRLLTIQQTAELLQLSRRTVMRMVQQKNCPLSTLSLSGASTKGVSPSGCKVSRSCERAR